jgi:hypothetical protein
MMSLAKLLKDHRTERGQVMLLAHCRQVREVPLVRLLAGWERASDGARERAARTIERSARERNHAR